MIAISAEAGRGGWESRPVERRLMPSEIDPGKIVQLKSDEKKTTTQRRVLHAGLIPLPEMTSGATEAEIL